MNIKSLALKIIASLAIGLGCCCKEKSHAVSPSVSKRDEKGGLHTLRADLSTPNGSSAYCELHHQDTAGFEEILQALANLEVSPDNFISWSYDLETRWPDGTKLSKEYEKYQFEKANEDEVLAKKLATYYSQFPSEFLEAMQVKGPGAQKVAALALQIK